MSVFSKFVDSGAVFRLRELTRKPGFAVAAFSFGSLVLVVLAAQVGTYIGADLKLELASGSVGDLLHIVASSMLAVTTFSIGTIVSALGRAASNLTPRATQLLVADRTAQNALSIFVGAFIYSVVGIIGIAAGYYEGQARIILFLVTLGVIALIVWSLLRWIDHLHHFGRTSDMIRRIEEAATEAAQAVGSRPAHGARRGVFDDGRTWAIPASESGYLRHVDLGDLDRVAGKAGLRVHVLHLAGHYVHEGDPLLRVSAPVTEATAKNLRKAFTIGRQRSFDQDMRYGLVVLSEVASRALSPAVNDPGTAIDVLRAGTRVLAAFHRSRAEPEPPQYEHVAAPDIDLAQAYEEFFSPIARDGAGVIEVQEVLQGALAHLAGQGGGVIARREAEDARSVSVAELAHPRDLRRLLAAHAPVNEPGDG